jgi:hypothetical protein
MATSGFSFPTVRGIIYENLITVFLNGYGGITNIFNQTKIAVYCNKQDYCRCPICTEG